MSKFLLFFDMSPRARTNINKIPTRLDTPTTPLAIVNLVTATTTRLHTLLSPIQHIRKKPTQLLGMHIVLQSVIQSFVVVFANHHIPAGLHAFTDHGRKYTLHELE